MQNGNIAICRADILNRDNGNRFAAWSLLLFSLITAHSPKRLRIFFLWVLQLGGGIGLLHFVTLQQYLDRIGHLGDLNEMMVLNAVVGAEMAMRDIGIPLEAGSGVAAANVE